MHYNVGYSAINVYRSNVKNAACLRMEGFPLQFAKNHTSYLAIEGNQPWLSRLMDHSAVLVVAAKAKRYSVSFT
jgi:hypothetical protein